MARGPANHDNTSLGSATHTLASAGVPESVLGHLLAMKHAVGFILSSMDTGQASFCHKYSHSVAGSSIFDSAQGAPEWQYKGVLGEASGGLQ